MPTPEMLMPALPPGVAEKVTVPVRGPPRLGENTMCTVQAVFGARLVLPDTQSKAPPVWTTKSALSDLTVIAPLVCWPVFVIAKLCALLDWLVVTEPKSRLRGEAERADSPQVPAEQVPPVEQAAPLATQVLATQQPPFVQALASQQGCPEPPQDTPAASKAASPRPAPLESGVAAGRSGAPASTGGTSVVVYGVVGGVKLLVHTAVPFTTRTSSMKPLKSPLSPLEDQFEKVSSP
jgi:hypothetical protein